MTAVIDSEQKHLSESNTAVELISKPNNKLSNTANFLQFSSFQIKMTKTDK